MKRVRWAAAVAALLMVATVHATTWVVAPGGGDFASIQAALDAAVAGDTIQVRAKAPAWFEKVVFPRSGNATDGFITLEAYPGETPVIDGTGVAGADLVHVEDRSWVRIAGFELRNDLHVNDGSGIRVVGAGDHVEIRGNDIHDVRGANAMGITVFGTAATPISNLVIDGNTVHDCEPAPSEALTLNGNVTDWQVTHNTVRDVDNIGIDAIGGERDLQPDQSLVARNGLIAYNTVTRARSSYGGGFAGGIYVDGGRDIVVEHNVVTESDLGLEVGSENAGVVARNVVVRDNVLHHNDKAGLVFGGYAANVGRVQNCEFRNNVLFENDTLDAGYGELWIQYASQNVVRDNAIVARAPASRLLTSDAGNVANVLDYNVWWATTPATFGWNGTSYAGFAAYRAGTGADPHSAFADPDFVDAAALDFHLRPTSPAVNAGDPATAVGPGETDVDGAPRLSGPRVDAGVDELTCGDGVVDRGEECDDGNAVSGDGCDANCTTTRCGNGVVTAGEACDDGNVAAGDCCDPTCAFETAGAPCDDGAVCTRADACDGAGTCVGHPEPEPVCKAAASAALAITNQPADAKDALDWKWSRGEATSAADLGDPANGPTDFTLCVYDTVAGVPHVALAARLPHGRQCGRQPCWRPLRSGGFRYDDRSATPDGVRSAQLRPGAAGVARLEVKGKGLDLRPPPVPLAQSPSVAVQLRSSAGGCWGAAYAAPATKNAAPQFRDRTP